MSKNSLMPTYGAGEQTCPTCDNPLPAHQTWPGARYRFCGAPICVEAARRLPSYRFIGDSELKCSDELCANFVPAGIYALRPSNLSCSAECSQRRMNKGSLVFKCGCGCGKDVQRASNRKPKNGLVFFSQQHYSDYVRNKIVDESCGFFRGLWDEYEEGFAKLRYRNPKDSRNRLMPFFKYLNLKGLTDLEQVTVKTITGFLAWGETAGHRNVNHDISPVSMFFKWAMVQGHRKAASPVVQSFHCVPRKHYLPRPYSTDEITLLWKLLHQRGNARLRLAAAIGVEAGLRIGEICRLKVGDIDPLRLTVFVRLPNKTSTERRVNCGALTKRYYVEWMAERNSGCGHDSLFLNLIGKPLKIASLADQFKRVLCKTFKGKAIHDVGFESWSTHRLRHTMATNLVRGGAELQTIMGQGGWTSASSAIGYAKVDEEASRRGYAEAMQVVQRILESIPSRKTITAAEFLARFNLSAPVQETQINRVLAA